MGDIPTQETNIVIEGRHYKVVQFNLTTDIIDITRHIPWQSNWHDIAILIEAGNSPKKYQMDVDKFTATLEDVTTVDNLADMLINKLGFNIDVIKNKIFSYRNKLWEIKMFKEYKDQYILMAEELVMDSTLKKEAAKQLNKELANERARRSNFKTNGRE